MVIHNNLIPAIEGIMAKAIVNKFLDSQIDPLTSRVGFVTPFFHLPFQYLSIVTYKLPI